MNNNIECVKTGIEERFNVKLRSYKEYEGEIIERALIDAAKLTQMYYSNAVVPIVFKVYIASKDICGIEAMSIFSCFEGNIIILSPRVLKRQYETILGTIIHEFVHLVAKTSSICNDDIEGDREIHEGLTELCSREIQMEACKRGMLSCVVCTKGYDEYVNYVINKIHEARMDIKTAATKYLNPNVNEYFINDVFPM